MLTHRVFLSWLIYMVIIVLLGAGLVYMGIPQIAIASDHSYLTLVLLGMYVISEVFSARQAWKISKEHVIASTTNQWLQEHVLTSMDVTANGTVILYAKTTAGDVFTTVVPASETALHLAGLQDLARGGNHVDQGILLEVLADRLHSRVSTIEFIAGRVVWVGILATILGVILAFWPLLGAGMAVEMIRLKLGGFFSGIAVAFIPTAASFVFKIALDFGTKILTNGSAEIVNLLARMGETKVLPILQDTARNPDK